MKLVERVLYKILRRIVTVGEMQFGFMPVGGQIDAVFILRRKQEDYHAKGKKLYMFLVHLKKTLDIVSSVGMGNEEERNTRSFGWISDESA